MQELDLRALLFLLVARIKWIILAVVVGAVLFGAYAHFALPVKYTSTAMLYMTNLEEGDEYQAATTGNLAASERLVKTVRTAATAPWALQEASSRLDGAVTAGNLSSLLTFSPIEETSFLRLSVTHTDPAMAQLACDAMAEVSVMAFAATGEKGSAQVYQKAVKATKTSPNVPRLTAIGGLIGFLAAAGTIVLNMVLRNTVFDKDDVQRHLDVPVLGEIPSFKLATKGGNH